MAQQIIILPPAVPAGTKAEAYYQAALAMFAEQKFNEAASMLADAIRKNMQDWRYWYSLAVVQYKMQFTDRALNNARNAAEAAIDKGLDSRQAEELISIIEKEPSKAGSASSYQQDSRAASGALEALPERSKK